MQGVPPGLAAFIAARGGRKTQADLDRTRCGRDGCSLGAAKFAVVPALPTIRGTNVGTPADVILADSETGRDFSVSWTGVPPDPRSGASLQSGHRRQLGTDAIAADRRSPAAFYNGLHRLALQRAATSQGSCWARRLRASPIQRLRLPPPGTDTGQLLNTCIRKRCKGAIPAPVRITLGCGRGGGGGGGGGGGPRPNVPLGYLIRCTHRHTASAPVHGPRQLLANEQGTDSENPAGWKPAAGITPGVACIIYMIQRRCPRQPASAASGEPSVTGVVTGHERRSARNERARFPRERDKKTIGADPGLPQGGAAAS